VFDRKTGKHAALGIYGQMIYIDPPAGIVAVKVSSWPDPLNDLRRLTTIRAIEAMAKALN